LKETTSKDLHSLVEYNELVANGSINRDESQGFDGAPVEHSNDSTCMEVTTDEDMSTLTMTQMEDPPSTASSQIQTASKKRDACELDLAEDDTKCNARQRTMLTPTPTAARLVSPPKSTKPVPVEQVCMKTGRVLLQFPSQCEAARSVNGANQRGISAVMDQKNKSYKGYVWRRQRVDSNAGVCMEGTTIEEMPPTNTQIVHPISTANKMQTSFKKRDACELDPEDDGKKPEARCDESDHQKIYDDDADDDDTDHQEIYDETEDQERLASPPPKFASVSLATATVMATAGVICGASIMLALVPRPQQSSCASRWWLETMYQF
jgi:hypothetical protein